MAKMTGEELRRRYAAGERDFSGVDLSGGNFTDANFTGANIKGGYLCHCNLTKSNFSNANLTGVGMTDSVMKRTSFRGANLKYAEVSNFGESTDLTDSINFHSVTDFSNIKDR